MPVSDIYPTTFDEDVPTEKNTNYCPECDGHITPSSNESVCADCGLVVDDQRLDHGPEWGSYDEDECRRTGGPRTVSRHDHGLSTTIGYGTDSRGNKLSRRKRRQLARMRREHSRGQYESKADRNLMHGFTEIRRIVGTLSLGNSLRDQACSLFRTAQSESLLRGRSIEGIAAACVFAAIRCNGLPRKLDEVATLAQVSQSRVNSCYKSLNAELGLPAKPMTPSEFVPQLASDLEVPDRVRRRAREYARRAQKEGGVTTGVRPSGFAAACLYKAGESTILTQDDVAEAADTTPVTVRTHWQTLNEVVD